MKFGFQLRNLLFLFVCYSVSCAVDDEHEDSTEKPSVTLDYETVTQIINALDSKTEAEEQNTEVVFEVTPSTDVNEQEAVSEDDSFQKRISFGLYKRPVQTKKVVISSHVLQLPDEPTVHKHYLPDEPIYFEAELKHAPCQQHHETVHETFDSSMETAGESYSFGGSLRGTPGVDYPDYKEIPLTSFSCANKHIPGFYADQETRCQVFHVCYQHRRESFLCPVGTTFNQPIKACDYWYSSNCTAASEYYDIQENFGESLSEEEAGELEEIVQEVFLEPEEPSTVKPVPTVTEKPIVIEIPVEQKPIVVPVPEPIVVKPVVSIPKRIVIKKPIQTAHAMKIASVKQFLPIKAQVAILAAKVVAAAVQPPVQAPVINVVKAAPVMPAATMVLKPVVKPVVVKKAVAKTVLVKAAKVKTAKVLGKKAVISALTKKHLALSLMRKIKGQGVRVNRPMYYVKM